MVAEKKAITDEEIVDIFKVLSNTIRLQIIKLLKEPEKNFPPQTHISSEDKFPGGICVKDIRDKIGLGQSTTSQYLSLLQKNGFLEMKRIGQWTYYRRNEKVIKILENFFSEEL